MNPRFTLVNETGYYPGPKCIDAAQNQCQPATDQCEAATERPLSPFEARCKEKTDSAKVLLDALREQEQVETFFREHSPDTLYVAECPGAVYAQVKDVIKARWDRIETKALADVRSRVQKAQNAMLVALWNG